MGGLSALAGLLATESFNRKPKACAFLPDVSLFGNACPGWLGRLGRPFGNACGPTCGRCPGFGLNDCGLTLIVCCLMRGI